MEEKLVEIFQDIFNYFDDPKKVNTSNTDKWDSLTHLNLILSIEEEFGVDISADKISGLYADFETILAFLREIKNVEN